MFEWVLGRTLKDMDMFDKLYEECYLGSLGEIKLKYLDDDLVQVEGMD